MASSSKAIVYSTKSAPFKGTEELDELIETLDDSKISTAAPYMPKGGEVYIYAWGKDNIEEKSLWRCDHHKWRQYGGRVYPRGNPKYFKEFSSIILDDGTSSNLFQRITFAPLNLNYNFIIIHYVGDHTLSKIPHRFIPRIKEARRVPFENLRKVCKTPKKQKLHTEKLEHIKETNTKTVKSEQIDTAASHYQLPLLNLSDSTKSRVLGWLNLKGLAVHLDGFIHRLTIIPVTVCICGSISMTEELTKVLELRSSDPQILWFCNSVKVDDYFITALMFRHLLLEGSPLMPLLFAIHDETFETAASEILFNAVNHIPQLSRLDIPIVCERSISKFVGVYLPRAKIIHTWGHIREETKNWLQRNGSTDSSQFTSQISEFLESKTPEEFYKMFDHYKESWPEQWMRFFEEELMPDIKNRSVRWALEELGVFSSYTGVISQVCAGYETVLNGFKSLACVTVDMLVLALNYLHNYLIHQARIAQCGVPCAFTVKREFKDALREEMEVTVPEVSVVPEDIVQMIRQQFSNVVLTDQSAQSTDTLPRQYNTHKIETETVSDAITESNESVLLIQAAEGISDESVIETVELPLDIEQLTQQTGLQRSLVSGKLFHTYPRNADSNL